MIRTVEKFGRITIIHTGRAKIQFSANMAKAIATMVIGKITSRTHRGVDMHGAPFKRYRQSYRNQLKRAQEDLTVDLRLSGQMLNSLGERSHKITKDGMTVTIGPSASSRAKLTMKGGQVKRKGAAKVKNNELAFYHQTGAGRLPRRPFLGLTKKETTALKKSIKKMIKKALK